MKDRQMDALLDFLYLASADPAAWPQFLTSTAKFFSATVVGLLARSDMSGHYNVVDTLGVDPEVNRLYNEYYNAIDPWSLALQERGIGEWIGPGSALCPPAQFETTEFYNDYWKMSVPAWFEAGIIFRDSASSTVLTLHRDRCQRDFDEDDTRILRALFPHLRRALAIHRKVTDLKLSLASTGGVVDALDVGLIGLGPGRTVCFTNVIAEGYLRSAELIAIRDGKLVTCDPIASQALDNLIRTASCRTLTSSVGGSLTIRNKARSLHLAILPAPGPLRAAAHQTKVFLTVTDSAAAPKRRDQLLATLFHLTPSEIRVVMLLLAGLEPSEIAEQTQTTAGTVRFQLKMVYRKMGVSRQSQLVRLVSRLPASASDK